MAATIANLRNLGSETGKMLAEIDIRSERDLRAIGAVTAYHRLKFRFGRRISINALYAMEGALIGCDWRDLDPETKNRLRSEAKRPPKQQ